MGDSDTIEVPDCMKPFLQSQIKKRLLKKPIAWEAQVGISQPRPKTVKNCIYCLSFFEIAEFCDKLLDKAEKNSLVLGLDTDWPNAYKSVFKTKEIHICYGENECAILNVSDAGETIPVTFTLLLKNPNVKLVGFNIRKDLIKLGKEFLFRVDHIIARLEDPNKFQKEKLSCFHKWSIKSVAEKNLESSDEEIDTKDEIEKFIFPGIVNYTKTVNDCGFMCERLLSIVKYFPPDKNLVFGFDIEWPFTYKAGPGNGRVALIQMCPEKKICFLFQVVAFKSLPKAFVLLLNHPRVRLTGLNIANDLRKIARDFRISVADILENRTIELTTLANQKLKTKQRWSLDGLVLNQLNKVLEKPKNVRISNWAADPLSRAQIAYAATDAYASLAVYNHLMDTESPDLLPLIY